MKKFLIILSGILIVTFGTIISPPVHASRENIISDAIFINEFAMDEAAINAFINQFPKSCLRPENYPADLSPISFLEPNSYFDHGTAPTSPARIINKMARYYHLNPQVILTTLEKEQGLVTGNLGCASWRYNSAMGYNCPDGSENALKDYPNIGIYRTCVARESNAGFARQINHATWQLRFDQERAYGNLAWGGDGNIYYYGRITKGWRSRVQGEAPTYYDGLASIDGVVFEITNGATASLYNYTPHFNSFERIFTQWFGSTQGGIASPLYGSPESPIIYAVAENTKYPLASPDVMKSFGWDRIGVISVSSAYLDELATGPTISSGLAKKKYDTSGIIYFFDDGKRYPITIQACKLDPAGQPIPDTTWAFDCFNSSTTLVLPNQLIDNFTAQDITLSPLVINQGLVWKMENGKRRFVSSPAIVDRFGGWGNAKWMQDYHAQQPIGKVILQEGDVVKFGDSPDINLITNAGEEVTRVSSPETYALWHLGARPNRNIPSSVNNGDQTPIASQQLGYCAVDENSAVHLITTDGRRMHLSFDKNYWIVSPSNCNKVSFSTLYTIPQLATSDLYRSARGDIFTSGYGVWYGFPTIDDLKQLGRGETRVINIPDTIQDKLNYGGGNLANNRLFKVVGSDQIRIVRPGGSLLVNSTDYPGLAYDKIITVDATTGSRYPIVGNY